MDTDDSGAISAAISAKSTHNLGGDLGEVYFASMRASHLADVCSLWAAFPSRHDLALRVQEGDGASPRDPTGEGRVHVRRHGRQCLGRGATAGTSTSGRFTSDGAHIDFSLADTCQVDYSEFLSATLASQNVKGTIEGPSILSAFSRLDTDGDGFITKEDIHAAFEGQLDDAEVAKMLRHQDPSGRLNYQGFKRMMLDDMTGAAGADVHPQKHDLCEESGCGQHLKVRGRGGGHTHSISASFWLMTAGTFRQRAVTKKRDRRISQVILGGGKGKGSLL